MDPMTIIYLVSQMLGIGGQAVGGYMNAKEMAKENKLKRKLEEWVYGQQFGLKRQELNQGAFQFGQSMGQAKYKFGQEFGLQQQGQQFNQAAGMPGIISQYANMGRRVV